MTFLIFSEIKKLYDSFERILTFNFNPINLTIKISPEFSLEKSYTLKVLLGNFLGVDFKIKLDPEVVDYQIICPNGKELILKDSFFNNCNGQYLRKDYLPTQIEFQEVEFDSQKHSFPVIYGDHGIEFGESKIEIHSDLIGSSFATLCRIEEIIMDVVDEHQRFPLKSSLADKFNYYHLPVVDIYCELIRLFLNHLDPTLKIPNPIFNIIPSHDIDYFVKWEGLKNYLGAIKRSTIKSKSINHLFEYSKSYLLNENPFDTIDYLNGMSEKIKLKARFYFLVGGDSNYDNSNFDSNQKVGKEFIDKITSAGNEIGIHPSYDSYLNSDVLKAEKMKLEGYLEKSISLSRQHYLRIKIPETLRALEEIGISEDASLGFAERPGFRCGTSRSYPFFDVENKKEMRINISPLIFMDTSILNDQTKSLNEHLDYTEQLKGMIEKYGGNWHFLLHNTNFFWKDENEYFKFWESLYN